MNIDDASGKRIVEISFMGASGYLKWEERGIKQEKTLPAHIVQAMLGRTGEVDEPEAGEGWGQVKEIGRALDRFSFEQTDGESIVYQVTKLLEQWQRRKQERDELKEQILLRQQQDAEIAEEIADEYLGSGRGRLEDAEKDVAEMVKKVKRLEKHIAEREPGWQRIKEVEEENIRLRRRDHTLTAMIHGVLDADTE